MRAFLLILGLLMVVALSALFAGPVLVDWNAYRGTFEKQATALLGREVRVGGNASLRLLPAPYMHFDNVRIADQTGRFDNPLLRVEGFTIWLSVPPLLRGVIEARQIELDGPDIRLSVDDAGKANWQGLAAGNVDLPFMPTEVSLASVKIKNGRLSLLKGAGAALFAVEAIDGELAAVKLDGPYRFKGRVSYDGAVRDVRVSTAALGAEHSLKVKAVVRVPDTSNAYSFDGDLLALDQLPRLAGTLEAQFGLSAAAFAEAAEGQADANPVASTMRLVGQIESDIERASLTDLNITFDSDGRPQLVTGDVGIDWKQRPSISARLAARWLDLDRIAGKPSTEGPGPALQGYVGRFLSAFAANAETRVVARIDQANLGGDLISNIALDARRTTAGIEIATLSAQLPGATTLDITGLLAQAEGNSRFIGPVRLSGASLTKLLKWAVPALAFDSTSTGGFYMIGADADIGAESVSLDRLTLEIDRSRITGSLRYSGAAQKSLALALDGDRLDLSEVIAEAPDLAALLGGWRPDARPGAVGGVSLTGLAGSLVQAADSDIRLRIGDLKTAAGRLENLDLKMRRAAGRVDLETLAFKTGSGLSVVATGSAASGAETADGLVRFRLEAPTAAAVATLDRFLALPEAVRAPAMRYALSAPLRLAGTIRQDAEGGRRTCEIAIDGSAAGERITLALRGDADLFEIAGAQADIVMTLSGKDGSRLLSRLAGRPAAVQLAEAVALAPPVPGTLTIRASGIPSTELATVAKLTSDGLSASFDGNVSFAGEAERIEGKIALAVASAAPLLDMLGIAAPDELSSTLDLTAQITAAGSEIAFEGIEARIDGDPVSGSARVAYAGPTPDIDIVLKAARVRLPGLLAPLLAAGPLAAETVDIAEAAEAVTVPAGNDEAGEPEAGTVWSDRPFRLAILDGVKARLRLEAGQLEVLNGLSLEDAHLKASSGRDGVVLESMDGNALGGAIKASGALRREPAGASLKLEASIEGAELEEIFIDQTGRSKAKGRTRARLAMNSSGLTPRGLIAVLEGGGELQIEDGQIIGLSPVTVDQAARLLLASDAKITQETIGEAIGSSRQGADFPMGAFATKLSVIDGTLRSEQVEIAAAQSTVRLKGKLDLDSMQVESDWTIAPKAQAPLKAPLPAVTIVYAGPIAEVRTLAAEADVEALERELLARRLIGGEEELEGLWPDALPREETSLAPDADRVAPLPADEAMAAVPEPQPAETIPGATESAKQTKKTTVKQKPAAEQQIEATTPPKPAVAKPKRRLKRKTVTIREGVGGSLR